MSNPRKKPVSKPQPRPPWLIPVVALAGIILTAILTFVFNSQQRTPFVPEVEGAPHAEVSNTVIDHGEVKFEQPVASVFRIRNVGDQPLTIVSEPRIELIQGC